MGRIWLAVKTFFRILGSAELAEGVKRLEGPTAETPAVPVTPKKEKPSPAPRKRSDALILLEALQREGRLLDFLYEEIESFDDAQIGSAVREVHRGSRQVLDRFFGIGPVEKEAEGAKIEVTTAADPARVRLVGNVTDQRPLSGELVHAGWRANRCELPVWSGKSENEEILAPAEIEIR